MTSQALTPSEYNMSFFSNLANFFSSSSDDSYDVTLHIPLLCGDDKINLSQEDRSQVVKEIKQAFFALSQEVNTQMLLNILNQKVKKAGEFNFFLYLNESKEVRVLDYSQGIPPVVEFLKVHKKSGQKTKEALQDLQRKSRTLASSFSDLKAKRKEIEEKILNLPYGVSPHPLEQKLKEVNRAIKAKEDFKAKAKKGKAKKAKGKDKKSSNMEFMFGEGVGLKGLTGSMLVDGAKAIARLKGYNRVVLNEKKKKAWFYKVEGDKTPIVYLKKKAKETPKTKETKEVKEVKEVKETPKTKEVKEVEGLKAKRKVLAEIATKQGMLDWS